MRGHHLALSRVGAAVAGPSSSVTRSTLLHHTRLSQSRYLATHADEPPSPFAPFQDLINEALRPTFAHSALLSPAPQKSKSDTDTKYAHHRQQSQTAATVPTKTSKSTVASTSFQPDQAYSSKKIANRAYMIVRFIRLNRILSAMAAFVEDVANPTRTPFTSEQLQDFVVALRIQCKKHSTTRPAPIPSDSANGELWRPARLDPSIPAKSLPIPIQCMYAMAAIYDVGLERNASPTAKMISAMLSTWAGYLSPDQLYQAADSALGHLVPPTATDQAACLRRINHRALSSFISTFGCARSPERGEKLLACWAKAQRVNGGPHSSVFHDDEHIDLTGWGQNVLIWQALIKSRVDAGDLVGAQKWLQRYRMASRHSQTPHPNIQSEPYLAYMAGIRRKAEIRKPSRDRIRRIMAEIRAAVQFMIDDHVPIESSVVAFVIDFEARVGNVDGGAALIHELGGFIGDRALEDPKLLRALFRFRKAAADAREAAAAAYAVARTNLQIKDGSDALPPVRSLIRSLVHVGEAKVRLSQEDLASCRSRGTLNAALMSAMAERDYPAAVVVLNLFERWRIVPSKSTYTLVVNPLIAQGHYGAFTADPGEVTVSSSKLNLEATLQSVARDTSDAQAQAILRGIRDQSLMGETSIFSAQPATALRQTQYLVRVLNRACAAEFENFEQERVVPDWLSVYRNTQAKDEPERALTEEAVRSQVKSAIFAAQDELLGTKEERQDSPYHKRLMPESRARLFSVQPSLSPHRWGLEVRAKGKQLRSNSEPVKRDTSDALTQEHMGRSAARSTAVPRSIKRYTKASTPPTTGASVGLARAFSTSAATMANDPGASCDLASASKGDYTHLEPVRTIYIPGFVPYTLGLALQEHLVKQRSDARAALRALADTSSKSASTLAGLSTVSPSASERELRAQAEQDTLLLLQHRPVYTEGRRHDAENELVSTHLRSLGAEYHLTKRGGQITYHGPGQLVGYPILNLASMNLASRCYVDRIQDSLISLLASRGIETVPPPDDHTGVWADEYHKIASIGIQVRHRVSSHGFALNVEQRAMRGFKHIVACGIVGRNMTCLQDRLDPHGPFAKYNPPTPEGRDADKDKDEKVGSIAEAYKAHFANVFQRRVRDVDESEFEVVLVEEVHRETLAQKLGIHIEEDERVVGALMVDGHRVSV
ncbi:hypothetical protein EX895_004693 [Sporisorium graminicola]|uniref:lipoyl(octanoyl) transferase n=1 Tax=Sporisorium graminicola TaxID=280036 RepID=A0A4U7KQ96_9BASI|nr:hypothetical protein EX895_004693 [Sporisorium graminicola]TKY86544.1 hypothetical protein EX895_004693 [Sporisorium graminicola]